MSYRSLVVIVGLLSILAVPAQADDVLDCKAENAASDDLHLYLRTDLFGSAKELVSTDLSKPFRIDENAPTHYHAVEASPDTPDSASEIDIDRLSGKLTLTHRLPRPALKPLAEHCDRLISQDECIERVKSIKGGNFFACIAVAENDCNRWRNGDNVLNRWHYVCQKGERKF